MISNYIKVSGLALIISLFSIGGTYGQNCARLFFSEYAEQGNNKYIEIYNPTSSSVTLTSNYSITRFTNGNTTGSNVVNIPLIGSIPAFGTFILARHNANATILAGATTNGMTSTAMTYNGDDALALFQGTDTLDIFGTIGIDPGSRWGTNGYDTDDVVLVRKSTIQSGDSTNSTTFDPRLEWDSIGNNVYTNMNIHTNSCFTGCTGFVTDSIAVEICSFDSVEFRGAFYNTTGIYRDTVLASCDTIFILNLTTTTQIQYDVSRTICDVNDSLLFGGNYLSTAGVYYDTISRAGNCDSITKLSLSVKFCAQPCSELFFSEYAERGNDKYLEIYNPTASAITLTGNYSVKRYANGSFVGFTIPLSGSIPAFGTFILSRYNSNATILAEATINGMIDSSAFRYMSYNGDDALALFKGTDTLDIFGTIGIDPGSRWGTGAFETDDNVLQRKSTIQVGVSANPSTFDPSVEWNALGEAVYTDINMHAGNCQAIRDTVITVICEGDSAISGVSFYKITGIYSDTLVSFNTGLDSIVTLDLLVNQIYRDTVANTICEGDSVANGTSFYSAMGMYSDTLTSNSGCDSILVLNLTISLSSRDTISASVCEGDSVTNGVSFYTMSGFNSDTLSSSISGCDSILVLDLTVTAINRDTMMMSICNGDSITFGGTTYSVAGIYSDTFATAGCDSISVLNLSFGATSFDTIQNTICQGVVLVFGSQSLTVAGTYLDTVPSQAGCDSIVVLELMVNPTTTVLVSDTICEGLTLVFGSQTLNMSGNYSDTSQNTIGCDSITILSLSVTLSVRDTISASICSGSTFMFAGNNYTSTGMYSVTNVSSTGCDSISSLNLTVISYPIAIVNVTACDDYRLIGGRLINYSGIFTDTLVSFAGCDSLVRTNLTINYTTYSTVNVIACDSYTTPSGKVFMLSGRVYDTLVNSSGCDSLMVINLTVKASSSETRTIDACFSYTQPESGNVYLASGTYTDIVTNSSGCNHTITTLLTINSANAGTISVSGITLTSSVVGVNYKWVDCDNNFSYILGATNQSYTPPRNGNYACKITTTAGCKDTSSCLSINSVSLKEFEINSNDINIFPNPAKNSLTIDILNQNYEEDIMIKMFNTVGKLVYYQEISSTNNKVVLDISKFGNGVYTITVSNEIFLNTKKVVISK